MARKLVCDRDGFEEADTDTSRKEWTFVSLSKLDTPSSQFQRMELCPNCTAELRRFFQTVDRGER